MTALTSGITVNDMITFIEHASHAYNASYHDDLDVDSPSFPQNKYLLWWLYKFLKHAPKDQSRIFLRLELPIYQTKLELTAFVKQDPVLSNIFTGLYFMNPSEDKSEWAYKVEKPVKILVLRKRTITTIKPDIPDSLSSTLFEYRPGRNTFNKEYQGNFFKKLGRLENKNGKAVFKRFEETK